VNSTAHACPPPPPPPPHDVRPTARLWVWTTPTGARSNGGTDEARPHGALRPARVQVAEGGAAHLEPSEQCASRVWVAKLNWRRDFCKFSLPILVVSRCLGIGPPSDIPPLGRCFCWPPIFVVSQHTQPSARGRKTRINFGAIQLQRCQEARATTRTSATADRMALTHLLLRPGLRFWGRVKTPRTAPAEHAQRRVNPDDKFSSLDGKFSSITTVETLSATVGSAGSGLVKRVDALEKAPSGTSNRARTTTSASTSTRTRGSSSTSTARSTPSGPRTTVSPGASSTTSGVGSSTRSSTTGWDTRPSQ